MGEKNTRTYDEGIKSPLKEVKSMVKELNKYETKELIRDIEDIVRDIKELKTIYPSTIKTCELLLSNMKYYCTDEWASFIEEQKKEFGENVWDKEV